MQLAEIVDAIGASPTGPVVDARITGVTTDSRTVEPGQVFFAVKGEQFDGHDYLEQAFGRGASACVVSRAPALPVGLCLRVDDTIAALGRLASEHRRRVTAVVIAVTGSNGKTTTKGMLDHLLSTRLCGRAAVKSFNNHLGVPLTLLSVEAGDAYLVAEIGSNAPGEVAHLAGLAAPDIAVVTSIGPAHLEGLGGIEGVVAEKMSLLRKLRPGGLAVVNADRPETQAWLGNCPAERAFDLITFGRTDGVERRVSDVVGDLAGTRFRVNSGPEIRLPVCGAHNALNAAAALAVSRRMGLPEPDAAEAFESYCPADMRLNVSVCGSVTVINDSYNANPASMMAAIDVLASSGGQRRVLAIGDMLELGAESASWHERVGAYAARSGVGLVVAVGSHADDVAVGVHREERALNMRTYAGAEQACAELAGWLLPGDVVLVKGSRAMGMERVARAIDRLMSAKHSDVPAG